MEKKLQNFQRNGGASLSIGKGVVVVGEVIATRSSRGVKLMVWQLSAKSSARRCEGIEEGVLLVRHTVTCPHRTQTAAIEACIMGHKGQLLNQRLNLCPHLGEGGGRAGIAVGQTVHIGAKPAIIIRCGVYEAVKFIYHYPIAHHNNTNRAYTRPIAICSLKIYCSKIS